MYCNKQNINLNLNLYFQTKNVLFLHTLGEFHNFQNNGLYVYSDGLFTNNSPLDVVVKDLGMKVNGNLNFEGQNIVFQMELVKGVEPPTC